LSKIKSELESLTSFSVSLGKIGGFDFGTKSISLPSIDTRFLDETINKLNSSKLSDTVVVQQPTLTSVISSRFNKPTSSTTPKQTPVKPPSKPPLIPSEPIRPFGPRVPGGIGFGPMGPMGPMGRFR